MTSSTAFIVSHTHWDRAWYWTVEQTRVRLVELMDQLIDLLQRDPEYRVFTLDGQFAMVEDYLAVRPDQRETIATLAQQGRLILGPLYVLPDVFIPSGESLVRNLRLGMAAAAEFGSVASTLYLPDPFGFFAQLPQIAVEFGLRGFIFARGMGDEGEQLGADFWWEAPDGRRILATHQVGGGYCNLANWGRKADAAEEFRLALDKLKPYCPHDQFLLNNGCDHLRPQAELSRTVRSVQNQTETIITHASFDDYCARIHTLIAEGMFRPQTFRGELRGAKYANLLPGTLSSRVDIKLNHHDAESELLRWAEPWLAIATVLSSKENLLPVLHHAWRQLLLCQPHDDICGCSIDAVHDDDLTRLRQVRELGVMLFRRALTQALIVAAPFENKVDETASESRLVWVNPHPWPVMTGSGLEIPALGYVNDTESEPVGCGDDTWPAIDTTDHAARIQTTHYDITVGANGAIQLHDAHTNTTYPHLFQWHDEADAGDTYDFSPIAKDKPVVGWHQVEIAVAHDTSSNSVILKLNGQLDLPIDLTDDRKKRQQLNCPVPAAMRIVIHASAPRIDAEITVHNCADAHRLSLSFAAPFQCSDILAGAPFQIVARPIATPQVKDWCQPPYNTHPFQDFVALQGPRGGLGIVAAGLREYHAYTTAKKTTAAITLLRAVSWLSRDDLTTRSGHAGPGWRVEGARQQHAAMTFRVAIIPFSGDWSSANLWRASQEFLHPPRRIDTRDLFDRPEEATPFSISPTSFLHVEPNTVAITAITPIDPYTIEVRLVNLLDKPQLAQILGPWKTARSVTLAGELTAAVDLHNVRLNPHEIATLHLSENDLLNNDKGPSM